LNQIDPQYTTAAGNTPMNPWIW